MNSFTKDDLASALKSIDKADGSACKITPSVIASLVEAKLVERAAADVPQLTDKGKSALALLESSGTSTRESLKFFAALAIGLVIAIAAVYWLWDDSIDRKTFRIIWYGLCLLLMALAALYSYWRERK